MSKIKDLYAVENGIDDLMPVDHKNAIKSVLLARANRFLNTEDWLYDRATWAVDYDDEGHKSWSINNLSHLADMAATDLVDSYIEDQHYDMSDSMYSELIDEIGDTLADRWEDLRPSLAKRKAIEEDEQWAQYETYNNLTLPKD